MIKRIAMWRLRDKQDATAMKQQLESLRQLPSLLDLEIGINTSRSNAAFDIAFIGLFEDEAALRQFEQDDYHQKVSRWVSLRRESRHVVDFEC
jgi:hypothetical protein